MPLRVTCLNLVHSVEEAFLFTVKWVFDENKEFERRGGPLVPSIEFHSDDYVAEEEYDENRGGNTAIRRGVYLRRGNIRENDFTAPRSTAPRSLGERTDALVPADCKWTAFDINVI